MHGILERQLSRQRLTRLFGGQFIIRYEHGGCQIVGNTIVDGMEAIVQRLAAWNRHGTDAFGGFHVPRHGEPAVHGRSHVVRMAFDGRSKLKHGITVEFVVLREGGRGCDARHNGLCGRAHASCLRNVVVSLKNEAHTAQTKGLACAAERGNHQVGFVTRESIGAFAFDHHLSRSVHRIGAQCEFKFVVVVQSKSDRIEARTKVGAGGRNTYAYFTSNWSHLSSSFVTYSLQM